MLLLKNGRVHIGNGIVWESCDILISDGKIAEVAQGLTADAEEVVDVQGLEVFPGFIDPVNSTGSLDITFNYSDTDEKVCPVTPYADVRYSFNPDEMMTEALYKTGVTTIGVVPGNANVIGGRAAVFHTYGNNTAKMLVKGDAALKGCVTSAVKEAYGKKKTLPMTKMGIFRILSDVLGNNGAYEKDSMVDKVLEGEIPLFMQAETKAEIDALLYVTKDYPVKLTITGAYQAERCLEEIQKQKVNVVIGDQIYCSKNIYHEMHLEKYRNIPESGCNLSFTIYGDYGPNGKVHYLWNAAKFAEAGYHPEEILKCMTLYPARILGIEEKAGTIEKGKMADLAVFSGNPLKCYAAKPVYTWIEGKCVYKGGGQS